MARWRYRTRTSRAFLLRGRQGHSGTAYSVEAGRQPGAAVLGGRVHAYEGYAAGGAHLRCPDRGTGRVPDTVVLTNASGGCADGIEPGDLVLITDHINLSGVSPLEGRQ